MMVIIKPVVETMYIQRWIISLAGKIIINLLGRSERRSHLTNFWKERKRIFRNCVHAMMKMADGLITFVLIAAASSDFCQQNALM
jgi:hypothetical protein